MSLLISPASKRFHRLHPLGRLLYTLARTQNCTGHSAPRPVHYGTVLFVLGLLLTIGAGVDLRAGLQSTWSMLSLTFRGFLAWVFGCMDWSHDRLLLCYAARSKSPEESSREEGL